MQIQARLDELNASIDRQEADGKLLEQLVEDAATSIPSWELRRCWRYAAWPRRTDFGHLPLQDDGIDLVAEKTDGDLVAIQCKARSSGSVHSNPHPEVRRQGQPPDLPGTLACHDH